MNFIENLGNAMNKTTTLNGAETYISTTDALLDFFALGGATRKNLPLGIDLFRKAIAQDKVGAIRILFYLRDVRGGQGERDVFNTCIRIVADEYPEEFTKIIDLIPEYGRYDDLIKLVDSKAKDNVIIAIKNQLALDFGSETPSLLAKWMPSENTSSEKTRKLAKQIRIGLGFPERLYRKTLSTLRAKIKLVEHNLTQKEYKTIDYSKLPSQAGLKYRKAFKKNDEVRYTEFLGDVKSGVKTINTKTLYTYQIYTAVKNGDDTEALDVMWNNLPDYTQGKNALVVADVSGSMSGDPMSVSVSLALYFADKNKGQFKDYFVTFSGNPILQKVVGSNIREKMNSIERSDWSMNTDLQKVFSTILKTAVANKTPIEEMPETLYIISDMEFDGCVTGTNFEEIEAMFAGTDYKVPTIVFWNVSAKTKQVPVKKNQNNVSLVSGFSTTVFKMAVENKSPIDLMNEVIGSERYAKILA